MKKDPLALPQHPCKNCGELFSLTRAKREFCGDTCRSTWHNARRKKALELAIKRGDIEG